MVTYHPSSNTLISTEQLGGVRNKYVYHTSSNLYTPDSVFLALLARHRPIQYIQWPLGQHLCILHYTAVKVKVVVIFWLERVAAIVYLDFKHYFGNAFEHINEVPNEVDSVRGKYL